MPQEDIILTTAVAIANKKYTTEEEELIHALGRPKAKIDVLIPDDMDPGKFDVALSAVSKVLVRATMQREAMFPILGRLLFVAEKNPDLWNARNETFEQFRLSLAERFGLHRQTSYDALSYARRWAEVLPPEEFKSVGRNKIRMISNAIGRGDEGKATARNAIEFAKEHTAEELDEYLDKKLHTGKGSNAGAFFRIPCNKKQLREFNKFFADPRVQAVCGSDKMAAILEHAIEECSVEWFVQGDEMIDRAAEAAHQAEKEEALAGA